MVPVVIFPPLMVVAPSSERSWNVTMPVKVILALEMATPFEVRYSLELELPLEADRAKPSTVCCREEIRPSAAAIWLESLSAVIPSWRMSSSASEICRLSPSAVAVRDVMFFSASVNRSPRAAAVRASWAVFSSSSSIRA